jgi:hypothetical protein
MQVPRGSAEQPGWLQSPTLSLMQDELSIELRSLSERNCFTPYYSLRRLTPVSMETSRLEGEGRSEKDAPFGQVT